MAKRIEQPPQTTFDPTPEQIVAQRVGKPLTVLSGPNNCGKSFLMKMICKLGGEKAHYFGCNRIYHLLEMTTQRPSEDDAITTNYRNFVNHLDGGTVNSEDNWLTLESVLRHLRDSGRATLFALFNELMDCTVSLKHRVPDDEMTPYYIDIDGENLGYSSTGTRLLLALLGTCLDNRFEQMCIDEPEMGLSPRIQSILGRFLSDGEKREKYTPHLKSVYLATHAHLLLDRRDITNNFIVTKKRTCIHTAQVATARDFHQLQFEMLGNDLEALFMPSAILFVEGKTDKMFWSRVLELAFPDRRITVVQMEGEGNVLDRLNVLISGIGDLARSPYHNRIFVTLDSEHGGSVERIKKKGVPVANIAIWQRNGIEYLYPSSIMQLQFACNEETLVRLDCEGKGDVQLHGIKISKVKLAENVAAKLKTDTIHKPEVEQLIGKIGAAIQA